MKIFKFILLLFLMLSLVSCASNIKKAQESNENYTVKVINSSLEKVLIRYENSDNSYTFKIVDPSFDTKFKFNGDLIIQYSLSEYDDAKILKIKQHTLIHVKKDDIIIDDLPKEEIINDNSTDKKENLEIKK